jgi:hypothetical protein
LTYQDDKNIYQSTLTYHDNKNKIYQSTMAYHGDKKYLPINNGLP